LSRGLEKPALFLHLLATGRISFRVDCYIYYLCYIPCWWLLLNGWTLRGCHPSSRTALFLLLLLLLQGTKSMALAFFFCWHLAPILSLLVSKQYRTIAYKIFLLVSAGWLLDWTSWRWREDGERDGTARCH